MLLSAARQDSVPKLHDNNPFQTRAAFRDGLYLGGLAAQRGEEPHCYAHLRTKPSPADRSATPTSGLSQSNLVRRFRKNLPADPNEL